ncbi:hypothetical protein [Arthrobacter sp. Z4-13]
MDPLLLGTMAASLAAANFFAKFAEKAGDEAGDRAFGAATGAMGKVVDWLKDRFAADKDPQGAAALVKVGEGYDSAKLQKALAEVIIRKAQDDPSFRAELEGLVEQARESGANASAVAQSAVGNDNVQTANIHGSTITISRAGGTGHPHSPGRRSATGS